MAGGKRYYWLKLKDDFFTSKRIKKLRKIAGGDTYTIIYLKMQLLSLKKDGVLDYSGLESTFAEELALDLDEQVEDVQMTLNYLISCGLAEASDTDIFLPYVLENTGSEGASAQRMRDLRAREEAKLLASPKADVPCVTSSSHCDASPSHRDIYVTESKREEIENRVREKSTAISPDCRPKRTKRFDKPSVSDIDAYCKERGNSVDPHAFFDYYESNGWRVGKNPMQDWKASVRYWERNEGKFSGKPAPKKYDYSNEGEYSL